MKIWAYAICWNEEKMLPYYLNHYSLFCDKIIIYDNESTDRSREIINSYPNTEIRTYKTNNEIRDDIYLKLKHESIYDAKGKADYVIVGDTDEFLYHRDIKNFLMENPDYVWYRPAGFQMVSDEFPTDNTLIYDQIRRGVPTSNLCKPILINPNLVDNIEFWPGQHNVKHYEHENIKWDRKFNARNKLINMCDLGDGFIECDETWENKNLFWSSFYRYDYFNDSPLKLLHYKYVGIDYVINRNKILRDRLSSVNNSNGWGKHYHKNTTDIFSTLHEASINVKL